MAILAIDQGTTGTTALIFSEKGELKAKSNFEFRQHYPKPGWVEHNPEEIWTSVEKAVSQALNRAKVKRSAVSCIGITNQRETVVVWNRKTGRPVHNAIVWQCRRTADFCDQLKSKKLESQIRRSSGLVVDAYFSASKIRWILNNDKSLMKQAKAGLLCAGTIDTYLIWRLTGGSHKTDVSNASRTQLMNIKTLKWDDKLCQIFSVPQALLPEIVASNAEFGRTKGLSFLPDGVPITGVAGDQQAALFGQGAFKVGDIKCTFGTGSFILMNTGGELVRSKNKLLTTVAWQLEGKKPTYALEGGAFICGAAVQWLRDELQIVDQSPEIEKLAQSVKSCDGVQFVPALAGLGAPHWNQQARGVITGLTRGSTRAHIARATLEAMALQNVDIFQSMEKDLQKKMKRIKVDGGACANNLLMQMQSDFSGVKVIRPKLIETTAAGAAYLAGLGSGIWKSPKDIETIWKSEREFTSQMAPKARTRRLADWHDAVKKA